MVCSTGSQMEYVNTWSHLSAISSSGEVCRSVGSSLHFAIHKCNLHSIHTGILGEWHPDFKQTLTNWIDMGPAGDLMPFQSHFVTFHDTR